MDVTLSAFAMASSPDAVGGGAAPASRSPDTVDPTSAARFETLMEGDRVSAPRAETAVPADSLAARTLGDTILGGLQRLSLDLQKTWNAVGTAVDMPAGPLTVQNLLKLQMELSSMTLQYELVNKAVTRSTQNIDQLVKLQ